MKFVRLNSSRDDFFEEGFFLYQTSFPPYEQRQKDGQVLLMSNPSYHFNVVTDQDSFAGILLYWEGSGYVYVEHFAIHPAFRGKAVGSRCLKTFCEKHSPVILEIDPPVTELSKRREHFYQRLGFKRNAWPHLHPAYQKEYPPHELVIMSYPQQLTESEYQLFRQELSRIVLNQQSS